MCNHRYLLSGEARAEKHCPFSALYERARGMGADALPHDRTGECLFHSRDVEWKRAHDFTRRLCELIDLLNGDGALAVCDFTEVVFVGVGGQTAKDSLLHLADVTFSKAVHFTAASFVDPVTMERVTFARGASFDRAAFDGDLHVRGCSIRGLGFCEVQAAGRVWFDDTDFHDYAILSHSVFTASESGGVVRFQRSRFEGIADFSDARFTLGPESSAAFWNVRFEDVVCFQNTRFHCHIDFDGAWFGNRAEFIDTKFVSIGSSARYRGAAVELKQIEVPEGAVLTFESTDPRDKMFTHDVKITFKTEPAGTIAFENVDFSKINPESRAHLMRLAVPGVVQIGRGCIKYRHQTSVRTIRMTENNASLAVDLCQTFTSYFTQSSGLNLGFEVVERSRNGISFFYFTDEDISEEVFLDRLKEAERNVWGLLSGTAVSPLTEAAPEERAVSTAAAVVAAVDAMSGLLATCFRVGTRIALGLWKPADTRALLSAIRFNEEGAEDRASSLHGVIVREYTGKALLLINSRQNALLLPMIAGEEPRSSAVKVRVLFLGANSLSAPMDLEREFAAIHHALKGTPNLELKQVWAATVDTVMEAMLEAAPTIVHFSGHGSSAGIVLRDATGSDKIVPAEALAKLFALYEHSLQCVVLSSCYSVEQARAIRAHVPYVVGMNDLMPDLAAIDFASGFYKAVAAERNIPDAFKFGLARIAADDIHGDDIPVLLS